MSSGEASRGIGSFFLLGIEHILTGYDHLLFLLALILRGGNLWSLFKIITAFTIAHSITLALAALNIVMLPERLVEATIALSIAYVAAENLFMRKAVSHRWAVSFLFGLVHGFGFSNVLRELGLPKEGLLWSLLNFNLGRRSRSSHGRAGGRADSDLAAPLQVGAARSHGDVGRGACGGAYVVRRARVVLSRAQSNPRSANDMVWLPPTIKWSSTLTSTRPSACLSALVSTSSARLGSAKPDG